MISFADSVNPLRIPGSFTHVAAYADGAYEWSPGHFGFGKHVMIAVRPGDREQARFARVLDVERYDARPVDFPPFARERHALGFDDPTAYSSILGDQGFGLQALLNAMADVDYKLPWRLWVAWWWGRDFPPAASEVLAEIRALTGIVLPQGVLWACQWRNLPGYDTSVLYGRDDFTVSR